MQINVTRASNGMLSLLVLDHADWDAARRLAQAIIETFRGVRGLSLTDFEGGSLTIKINEANVLLRLSREEGVRVIALDPAGNGAVCNIANWLGASAGKLGLK